MSTAIQNNLKEAYQSLEERENLENDDFSQEEDEDDEDPELKYAHEQIIDLQDQIRELKSKISYMEAASEKVGLSHEEDLRE